MQVTVEMPDQVARQWGETPDTVGRHVMEDAAIEGYRAGRLTQRQVGAMLGLEDVYKRQREYRALMRGSGIRASHLDCTRVQDPYSFRCQPQVMGA